MLSVETVKELEKKNFLKNHMIVLRPKPQQLESVNKVPREASLATLQLPLVVSPMA